MAVGRPLDGLLTFGRVATTTRWEGRDRMQKTVRSFVMVCAIAAQACGPANRSSPSPRDRDVLTRAEIASAAREGSDLYETLQALRPHFLQTPLGIQRGSAPQGTAVYVDAKRVGGLEVLRTIFAGNIDEVRYLGPTQSQNELGPTASLGALLVKLHRPSDRIDTTFEVTPAPLATPR